MPGSMTLIPSLITGSSGFIGGKILQPKDRAFVRRPSGLANECLGDISDIRSLERACAGIEQVVHCAGYCHDYRGSSAERHHEVNYIGTTNLLEAAVSSGVRRFVYLSTVKAAGDPGGSCVDEEWKKAPETPYGISKRAAEQKVLEVGEASGMHVVNLRLAMVYGRGGGGNMERMAQGIRAGWFPPLPQTNNLRSIVHIDDVISAVKLVLRSDKANRQTYIVSHPVPQSGRDIYDALRRAIKGENSAVNWSVPEPLFRFVGRVGDYIDLLKDGKFSLTSETVGKLLDSSCYSSGKISKELGWVARVDLKNGLSEMFCE